MKVTALKTLHNATAAQPVRGTEAQDRAIQAPTTRWGRRRVVLSVALGALAIVIAAAWLIRSWANADAVVSRERLRLATVTRGAFVRDVAASGTVVAANSPTLFAIAAATINYQVRAGDAVKKGDVLAVLDSPVLRNAYERERASLGGIEAALSRQEIEMRRQMLKSRQEADVANVTIHAAERELKRAQWAWEQRALSEREIRKAEDDVATAKLTYEHARATAALESESLTLDLRMKKAERDRQAFVVENLKSQVEELTVRSPVDGIVANIAQAQRARIAESAPLLGVVDLSEFEVEVQIGESYARDIKPAMHAEISLDGRIYPGRVAAISPEVRQNQVTGRVKFASSQPQALRQNQRASVRIVLDERTTVLKFERGPLIDANTGFVYLLHGRRAVRVPVQLGSTSIADVEVLNGLDAGDQVVVSDTRDFAGAPELTIAN